MVIEIDHYILLSTVLFCIGITGVLVRRTIISMFMGLELMLNAINILVVAFSRFNTNASGQVFVFFTMIVAAAEIAVGLAILVMIYRNMRTTDIEALRNLKN